MYMAKPTERIIMHIMKIPQSVTHGQDRASVRLRKAIEREEFILFYQAQMDITEKKVVGFEALIRWKHPDKGLLYPNDFIYLAEKPV